MDAREPGAANSVPYRSPAGGAMEGRMNLTPALGASLRYDEFWRWLREHAGCIVEAGTTNATLLDFEDYHWVLAEEEDGRTILQMLRGKNIVGELLIHPADVRVVDGSPDIESGNQGQWVFEAMGGPKEDPSVVAYFVMSHGIDEETAGKHKVFKH